MDWTPSVRPFVRPFVRPSVRADISETVIPNFLKLYTPLWDHSEMGSSKFCKIPIKIDKLRIF